MSQEVHATVDAPPAPVAPVRSRGGWKQALLAVVILVAGGVIGAGITAQLLPKKLIGRRPSPGSFPQRMREHMKRDLGLTPDQAKRIEAITKTRMTAVWEIQQEVRPRIDAEIAQMNAEIRAELNPEQQKKWDERMKRFDDMRKRFGEMRRRGGPHGKGFDRPRGGPRGRPGAPPDGKQFNGAQGPGQGGHGYGDRPRPDGQGPSSGDPRGSGRKGSSDRLDQPSERPKTKPDGETRAKPEAEEATGA